MGSILATMNTKRNFITQSCVDSPYTPNKMKLQKRLLPHPKTQSLTWQGDVLVDWILGGTEYHMDGTVVDSHRQIGYRFDKATALPDGSYAAIFEELGTKGLIIRNELTKTPYRRIEAGNRTFSFKQFSLHEINRSYYHADDYSYPIALFHLPNGRPAILHCPDEYNRLEIDLLENGKRLTASDKREPSDAFHSCLQVSSSGRYALSAGWVWHPVDALWVFDLHQALEDPTHLDADDWVEVDVASATFLADDRIALSIIADVNHSKEELLGKSQINIYDPAKKEVVHEVGVSLERLTLLPTHDERYVWDVYEYPKVIDLHTGEIVAAAPEVKIFVTLSPFVTEENPYALHEDRQRLAVGLEEGIMVLDFESAN